MEVLPSFLQIWVQPGSVAIPPKYTSLLSSNDEIYIPPDPSYLTSTPA